MRFLFLILLLPSLAFAGEYKNCIIYCPNGIAPFATELWDTATVAQRDRLFVIDGKDHKVRREVLNYFVHKLPGTKRLIAVAARPGIIDAIAAQEWTSATVLESNDHLKEVYQKIKDNPTRWAQWQEFIAYPDVIEDENGDPVLFDDGDGGTETHPHPMAGELKPIGYWAD